MIQNYVIIASLLSKLSIKEKMKHLKLGASIYVPSTRSDITSIANEEKFACRSVIFCTEDSVNEDDVPKSLSNIESMLKNIDKSDKMMKFIRVRNTSVLTSLLQMGNIDKIDGFVLPKVTAENFPLYFKEFSHLSDEQNQFQIMPTLETKEVFNSNKMQELCELFLNENIKKKILSIRIGGNDLLHILGIRRSATATIYESPLGMTISNLVTIFKPHGFNLTAPVCEFLQDIKILNKETPRDLEYGLFGKTAIHPDHIKVIETFYMVKETHLEMATAILKKDAPAVFGMHGVMCEKATHSNWANETLKRAEIYGVFGAKSTGAK